MSTSCKMVTLIMGSLGGNQNVTCNKLTLNGRTHCEQHREQELRRLWLLREDRRRARDLAERDYLTYLSEGYGP